MVGHAALRHPRAGVAGQQAQHGNPLPSPLVRKVDCIQVPVPALADGLAFYRDKLGHAHLAHLETAAGLRLPDTDAELVLQTERPGSRLTCSSPPPMRCGRTLCRRRRLLVAPSSTSRSAGAPSLTTHGARCWCCST